jgi:peptidoglycan/LPS O-acetylase OafA/YrhL
MLLYFFQIFGFAIMLFVLLIPRTLQLGNTWPQSVHSFYLSAGKVFFVLGLYIMILPSLLDIQNITFFLMDTKIFNFISKISFWTYLIHYMIIVQIAYSQKVDFYYTV